MLQPDRRARLVTFGLALAVLAAFPLAVVATDAFTDVGDSNVHHDDIAWLKEAGVTVGCNPPDNTEYCPGDPVLRQQMASFMRRLAENRVVDAATAQQADDADRLDGQDGTAYSTIVAAANCSIDADAATTSCGPNPDGSVPDETTIELLAVDIDAPTGGTVVVDAFLRSSTTNWVTIDDQCAPYSPADPSDLRSQVLNGLLLVGPDRASGVTATSVESGEHTLRLCSVYEGTDGAGVVFVGNLIAEWTAGGSVEIQSAPAGEGNPLDLSLLDG